MGDEGVVLLRGGGVGVFILKYFKVVGADPHRDLLLKALHGFYPSGVLRTTNSVPDRIVFARNPIEPKERDSFTRPCAPAK